MEMHAFKCTHQGWDRKQEIIWFDTAMYTEDEAKAQFEEVEKVKSLGNGHCATYIAYEYEGELFYEIEYLGVFDEDNLPGR